MLDSNIGQSKSFSWRSAFLGASVGIAGPAYFGTLFSNVTLWIMTRRGYSIQDAYAYIGQYSLSFPLVVNLVADVCFALLCGYVSVAYGRGKAFSQGIAAGFLTVTFPIIMFLSPGSSEVPLIFKAASLGAPVLGSIVGAYLYVRKT
jgi:hypothetical protein